MAIGVSQAFKDAMKAPVKVIKATIAVEGGSTYTSADDLMNLTLEASGYYFSSVTKTLEFNLLGVNHNLIGKNVHLTLSVLTDSANDTWADCDLGWFRVYEQDAKLEKETMNFKAYDKVGILAYSPYIAGGFNFPCTIASMVEQLCDNNGFQYDNTQTLVNGSQVISEDLYEKISDITYRDILSEIAGATATIAQISGIDNTLTLRETTTTASETWTYANLKKIKFEPKYGVINSVVLSRKPQEDNVVVRDEQSISDNGLCELKLANNELLDDNREEMAQPILDSVDGFDFYPFEATTEGHGWHECGDRIEVVNGNDSWDIIVTYIKLSIDGGIKETIKGVRPDEEGTDYALAGGIMKTIYNTEIKTDKQGQQITAIVSRQDTFENQTLENFSQVTQNINSITTTIQTTGGGNLIHNSVGYNIETDGTLVHWTKTGTVTAESSPESVSYGAISGNQINLVASSSITQRVIVDGSGSQKYTLAFRAKKGATGDVTVHLQNDYDDYTVVIPEGEAILWEKYTLEGVEAHSTYFDVIVEADASVTEVAITDLMLTVGDTTTPWVQAADEILSKNVAVDSTGVKVSSSSTNDYVQLNELGLNGYSDASGTLQNVFTINRDLTEVARLKARQQILMPPIKIVPITSGTRAGWCFVKSDE